MKCPSCSSPLTDSEHVLLAAIAEACMAVRHAWQEQENRRTESEAWRDKAKSPAGEFAWPTLQ